MTNKQSKTKFTGKADIYDKFRPEYSEEFVLYLYSIGIIKKEDIIADIGAGTGILSNSLAKGVKKVICIEPNADMLRVAKERLLTFKNCEFLKASAEATTLPSQSVNCITVAQAFHWFDMEKFKFECQRILKPDGNVVLAWNVTDNLSPINIDIAKVNEKLCPKFSGYSNRSQETTDVYDSFFEEYSSRLFQNDLYLDELAFVGRYLSRSYAPNKNDTNYEQYIDHVEKVFEKHSIKGKVKIPNYTKTYYGKV